MRATSIIYRRELGAYLRSPLSWVIASVLLLGQGIFFQIFGMRGERLSATVLEAFFNISSYVAAAGAVILSFRTLAEERQTGSLVILTTSPVRDYEIVLGKFLAGLTFLAIMLAMSIYLPILIKVNGKITVTQIAVGYLGLLLFGSACLAIGMFGSSLTRHQFVALIVGFAIIVILGNIYQLATKLDPPVRGVIEQVDLWWIRFQGSFQKGILNLKDVVFYLGVTYFFLLLSTKTLEAKRWQ